MLQQDLYLYRMVILFLRNESKITLMSLTNQKELNIPGSRKIEILSYYTCLQTRVEYCINQETNNLTSFLAPRIKIYRQLEE